MGGKIYAGILVDGIPRVTEDFIDDDQEGLGSGRGYVDQIFTLKQIGEKAWERNHKVYVGFMDRSMTELIRKQYDSRCSECMMGVVNC